VILGKLPIVEALSLVESTHKFNGGDLEPTDLLK